MTMIARGECHDLATRGFERLVSLVSDGARVLPVLYLRLLQMAAPPEFLERCLFLLPVRYEGLRMAIAASIRTYRMPLASPEELHEAAELFSASVASPGLGPLDRPGAFWMGRLIERDAALIDRGMLECYPRTSNILFSSSMDCPPATDVDIVFLCAGDPSYFFAFSESYINSVIRFCPMSSGIHFVLLDFPDTQVEWARTMFTRYARSVVISCSTMKRSVGIDRSFYCIARYYELLRILHLTRGSAVRYLAITDIDHVFVHNIEPLIAVDESLLFGYVLADYLFPWARFRANLLLINLARDGADLEAAVGILRQNLAMILTGKTFWFIDQASIAAMLQMLVHSTGHGATVRDITKRYLKTSFQPTGDRFDAQSKLRRMRERGHCDNPG
jgi:hypothetical protein